MDIGDIIFETPAWLLGHAIGIIIATVFLCGTLAFGIYLGAAIYERLRVPYLRVVVAIFVSAYAMALLYRSMTWTGVFLVQVVESMGD